MAKIGKLRVLAGFVKDKDIVLPTDKAFSVGRDRRRNLPIMSRKVSREHCTITCENNVYTVTDHESKHGTLVNSKKITSPTRLRAGDTLLIGNFKAEFILEEEHARREKPKTGSSLTAEMEAIALSAGPRIKAKPKDKGPAKPPAPEAKDETEIDTPPPEDVGATTDTSDVMEVVEFEEEPPIISVPKPKAEEPVISTPRPARRPHIDETPSGIEITGPAFSAAERAMVGKTISSVRLIAALNKGRFTVVYKGIHDAKNRVVAFKMLNEKAMANAGVVRWFIAGAQAAGSFRHEDAVSLLGGGREIDCVFVFSRFMDGGSAQDRFARAPDDGLPAVKRALETIVHLARALEFAHSKGIHHLGVKPSKVLYDEKRRAKLNGLGYDNGPLGFLGGEIDTAYVAPEQVASPKDVGLASDIYGLGATFFYMLTGARPARNARQRVASPKSHNRNVPDSLCRIVEKMVDPDPGKRYRSYGQLLHDVRWALRGEAWPRA